MEAACVFSIPAIRKGEIKSRLWKRSRTVSLTTSRPRSLWGVAWLRCVTSMPPRSGSLRYGCSSANPLDAPVRISESRHKHPRTGREIRGERRAYRVPDQDHWCLPIVPGTTTTHCLKQVMPGIRRRIGAGDEHDLFAPVAQALP